MGMFETTWRMLISERMGANGEDWGDVVSLAAPDGALDHVFRWGYGSRAGDPFTLWTRDRVYFPVDYDGIAGVRSVPRHPCSEMTWHAGGDGSEDPTDPGVER